jgi:predicted ester cyclase
MSTDENKAIVAALLRGNLRREAARSGRRAVAADYVDHGALPGQAPGLQGAKQKWATYIACIRDMRVPIDALVAEADRVVVRFTVEGTHHGALLGIPPTGKRLRACGISIYRLAEGRIAENWEEGDRLGLLQQLGAIPAQAPSGDKECSRSAQVGRMGRQAYGAGLPGADSPEARSNEVPAGDSAQRE